MKGIHKVILGIIIFLAFSTGAAAQFNTGGFGQQNTPGAQSTSAPVPGAARTDTTNQVFSFKVLGKGLAHKSTMPVGYAFGAGMVIPGLGQFYNKDYWKIPIIWAGMGTCIGLGVHNLNLYKASVAKTYKLGTSVATGIAAPGSLAGGTFDREGYTIYPEQRYKDISTAYFIGAGLIYWASLLDVNFCYEIHTDKSAGKATIYSILLPGLGQAYNGEYWKIPIYTGLSATGIYLWTFFNTQYRRFKRIHNEATSPAGNYTGPISAETALWYRDSYRRNRDLAIVGTMLVYVLNIIDANVFSYMGNFDITDDLAVRLEPAVISPIETGNIAMSPGLAGQESALGMRMSISF